MLKESNEKGAIIVEASIVLPIFMFMMFILLQISQIAMAEAKIGVTLDRTAKEMAQYAHIYYVSGLASMASGTGGTSSQIADELGGFIQKVGELTGSDEIGEFGEALAGDSIMDLLKNKLGAASVRELFKKNISSSSDPTEADMTLIEQKYHIVPGSMSFGDSKILEKGSKDLFLQIDYDIQVVRLLSLDVKFHMRHVSYAKAWA